MANSENPHGDDPMSELWSALEEYESFVAEITGDAAATSVRPPVVVRGRDDTQVEVPARPPHDREPEVAAGLPQDREPEVAAGLLQDREPEVAVGPPQDREPGRPGGPPEGNGTPTGGAVPRPLPRDGEDVVLDAEITLPGLSGPQVRPTGPDARRGSPAGRRVAVEPGQGARPAPAGEAPGWRPVPTADSPGWRPAQRSVVAPKARAGSGARVSAGSTGSAVAAAREQGSTSSARASGTGGVSEEAGRARQGVPQQSGDGSPAVTGSPEDTPRGRVGGSLGIWGASDRGDGRRRRGILRELPVLLLVALLLAFLLRTFVVQVFFIPSSSMEPTLNIDDRMVVEKLTYRLRDPLRGEIVVFEGPSLGSPPADSSAADRALRTVGQFLGVVPASARDYVKRVIGVEGDVIEIVEGQVLVNGHALSEPYVLFSDADDFGPVTVPEGELFFLGDNRPNSSDSRRSLGFVASDDVVGRAAVIIWPPANAGLLTTVRHEPG